MVFRYVCRPVIKYSAKFEIKNIWGGLLLDRVSKRIYYLLVMVIITLLLGNVALFFLISNIRTSADIINTSGRIRGNIQRFAKYIIAEEKNYTLVTKIDRLINKLKEEEESIFLIQKEDSIADNIDNCWKELKNLAKTYTPQKKSKVMEISERCWVIADDMTANFEKIAKKQQIFILDFLL